MADVICFRSAIPVLLLLPALSTPALAQDKTHYCYSEELYADIGGKKEKLGTFKAVATLATAGRRRTLEYEAAMPDSGQTISFGAGLKPLGKNRFTFRFEEGGWSITGRGSAQLRPGAITVRFTQLKSDEPGSPIRNFSDATLSSAVCANQPQLFNFR